MLVTAFILLATILFLFLDKPVKLLILAGAVTGLILPLALSVVLLSAVRKNIVGDYRQPVWMQVTGWIVVALVSFMGFVTIRDGLARL
jgi:Mn2+/Fe2+ NRAMP family transporter